MADATREIFDLVSVPVTEWATTAVLRTFNAQRSEDPDRSSDSATWVTVRGGEGYLRHPDSEDASRGAPEVVAVTLSLDGWTYADALAEIESRCGRPATMGGDGPWLRWPTSDTRLIVLDCLSQDEPLLHLEHAEWNEQDEYWWFKWGEVQSAPYQWRIDLADPPNGTWFPGGFEVDSLDGFETQFGEVCASLAHAATVLPDSYLQAVNVTVLRRAHREEWVQFYATGHRLFGNVGRSWQEVPQGKPKVEELVEVLLEEIRRWGVEPSELSGGGYATLGPSAAPMPINFTTLDLDELT